MEQHDHDVREVRRATDERDFNALERKFSVLMGRVDEISEELIVSLVDRINDLTDRVRMLERFHPIP